MQKKNKVQLFLWLQICFFCLTLTFLLIFGNLKEVLADFLLFFAGNFDSIDVKSWFLNTFSAFFRKDALLAVLGLLSIDILIPGFLMHTIIKKIIPYKHVDYDGKISRPRIVQILFEAPVFEEILFRLGLFGIPFVAFPSNTAVFYIFLLLSNGIWAYGHLGNYKFSAGGETKIIRIIVILPYVLGGFLQAFVFVKFGLLAAIALHMFHNITALASILIVARWA